MIKTNYNGAYYKTLKQGSMNSAKETYAALSNYIEFKTVVDIGCGIGAWNNDSIDYTGVDHNNQPKDLMFPAINYFPLNFEKEIYESKKKFDLCICMEVAEHVSQKRSDVFIKMLCRLSNQILFSAAIPGQGGMDHINEQWQSWWSKKFAANGFYPYQTDFRKILFSNPDVEAWYKNNMILYTKKKYKIDYELDFVHPELFTGCVNHLKFTFKR